MHRPLGPRGHSDMRRAWRMDDSEAFRVSGLHVFQLAYAPAGGGLEAGLWALAGDPVGQRLVLTRFGAEAMTYGLDIPFRTAPLHRAAPMPGLELIGFRDGAPLLVRYPRFMIGDEMTCGVPDGVDPAWHLQATAKTYVWTRARGWTELEAGARSVTMLDSGSLAWMQLAEDVEGRARVRTCALGDRVRTYETVVNENTYGFDSFARTSSGSVFGIFRGNASELISGSIRSQDDHGKIRVVGSEKSDPRLYGIRAIAADLGTDGIVALTDDRIRCIDSSLWITSECVRTDARRSERQRGKPVEYVRGFRAIPSRPGSEERHIAFVGRERLGQEAWAVDGTVCPPFDHVSELLVRGDGSYGYYAMHGNHIFEMDAVIG